MSVMISVNPPYSMLIEAGYKQTEFRNKIIKAVKVGTTVYIYETKNKGGSGCVTVQAKVKNIVDLRGKDLSVLREQHKSAMNVLPVSDVFEDYLELIGYTKECEIGIVLEEVRSINLQLSDFVCNDKTMIRPPQNMCSCEFCDIYSI